MGSRSVLSGVVAAAIAGVDATALGQDVAGHLPPSGAPARLPSAKGLGRLLRIPWQRMTGLPSPGTVLRTGRLSLSGLIGFLTTLHLVSYVVDAPLRYVLSLGGLAPLIYLRDLFPLVLLALALRAAALGRPLPKLLPVALLLVGLQSCIGLLILRNVPQVLFGIKVLLPLFLGILLGGRAWGYAGERFEKAMTWLWCIAVVGLALNVSGVHFPWEGFDVNVGGYTINGQRNWTAVGIPRLSGFARASFDTAMVLLLLPWIFLHRLRPLARWAVLLVSFAGIVGTTTKGAVMAGLAALAVVVLHRLRLPARAAWWRAILFVSLALLLAGPLLLRPGHGLIDLSDPVVVFLLASFMERIESTWPDAFALLDSTPAPLLGRGVGGIGVAQQFFEPAIFSPGDNLFVYLWVAFGVLSVLVLWGIWSGAIPRRGWGLPESKHRHAFFVAVLVVGVSTNVVESSLALCLIGFQMQRGRAARTLPSGDLLPRVDGNPPGEGERGGTAPAGSPLPAEAGAP